VPQSSEIESDPPGTDTATPVRARGWSAAARAGVATLAETWGHLEACERMMVAGTPRSEIVSRLGARGVARSVAKRMQGAVAKKWANDREREGAAQRLDRYRAILEGAIAEANSRDEPDTKSVIAAVALLAKLNGDLDTERPNPESNGAPQLPSGEVVVLSEVEVEAELQAHRRAQRDG